MGNPFVRTPTVDRLAREGVLFNHCYAQNPLCTPSRGAFLTGRYPSTNRLRQNGQVCPRDLRLVTKILAEQGYVCGLAGKLHLNACDNRLLLGPEWWRWNPKAWFKGAEPRIDDGYAEFDWCHAGVIDEAGSAYARWLLESGITLNKRPYEECKHIVHGPPVEHHQTTWCFNKAIGFIEAHQEQPYPWLYSVNMFAPHYVFDPPDEYMSRYLPFLDEIPLPNYVEGELDNKPDFQKQRHAKCKYWNGSTARQHRLMRAAYWALCDLIDDQLARLLAALDRTGQRQNTIVIFTSDHGEMLGDHGYYIKGPFLYDPAIRVPLIVSYPGAVKSNIRSDAMVELFDLAPTILEAVGLPRDPGMQARSLWPLLTGKTDANQHRDDVYCEYLNANPDSPPGWLTMVRNRQYKIMPVHGTDQGELYDLQADLNETHNLWHEPGSLKVKCDMLSRLCARQAWTADPLPPRIGVY